VYSPAHPGEFIREVYLEPLELSYRAVTQNKLQSLIRVKACNLSFYKLCSRWDKMAKKCYNTKVVFYWRE